MKQGPEAAACYRQNICIIKHGINKQRLSEIAKNQKLLEHL